MPANYGRQIRRVPVTASARRLVHRRIPSLRLAPQLRQPLSRRGLHGARDRVRFPMRAPTRFERRLVHLRQPATQASAPIAPQRRSAAFAWALVAAGVVIWATALGSANALFPSSAPVAAAVAAPVMPAVPEHAVPAPANEEYVAAISMRENVWRAIAHATEVVGVDAAYMTAVAARESGFDPVVRAQGTTATGLYQFTEDTWLRALKLFGVRHGLTELAQQITIDEYGDVSVRPGARAKLLQLRNDPKLSALMAAELARDNKARLEHLLGRDVSPAETYLAHFLGVGQAARIIAAAHSKPHVSGARLLPAAARSNPAVFAPAGHVASAGAIVGKIEAYFSREVSPLARI
ncbi:MAG TPA: hypothetical protein VF930_15040 [Stellaceae bacterium]